MADKELDRLHQLIQSQGEGEEQPSTGMDHRRAYKEEQERLEKIKTWPCNIWDLGLPLISLPR